jgi:hypothetical protein
LKLIIKIIAFINLLPVLCCGQQVMWQNHYGGDGYEGGLSHLPSISTMKTSDGYVVCGNFHTLDTITNQYVVKADFIGNKLWDFNVGIQGESDMCKANVIGINGDYFMVGKASFQGAIGDPIDIRITKFTDEGNVLFSKIIDCNIYQSVANDICYTPDDNYIAACASNQNIILLKFDSDGDTLWTSRPLPDSIGSAAPIFFQPLPDFSAYYGITYQNSTKIHWFKTDTAGNLLDIKQLVLPGNEDEIFEIYKAMMLPNGNIMVHGRGFASIASDTVCPQPGGYYGVLHEYNPQGELVRERKFCPPLEGGNTYYEYFDDFIVNADGSVYMIRRTRLKKLDANWQDVWEYELDLAPEVNLLKIAQFEPNYLIAAGELWIDIEDTDIFMCKIALPEAIGVEENEEEFKFNAYPNPTSGHLTLESSIQGITYYRLIAIDGRLVAQGSFTNKTEIDLVNTSAGAYHLQLQDQEGKRVYGRVISKQ